jgi:hypothetical protein
MSRRISSSDGPLGLHETNASIRRTLWLCAGPPVGASTASKESLLIPRKSLFELARALEGLPVLGSLAGTPAARAGVRYGDVLISVNGRRTRTVADYVEAKNLRPDGMEIVVFRGGAEQNADLVYDHPATPLDPAALVAELVTLRIAGDALGDGGDPSLSS